MDLVGRNLVGMVLIGMKLVGRMTFLYGIGLLLPLKIYFDLCNSFAQI